MRSAALIRSPGKKLSRHPYGHGHPEPPGREPGSRTSAEPDLDGHVEYVTPAYVPGDPQDVVRAPHGQALDPAEVIPEQKAGYVASL
jgi:hypothetical protein